MKTQENIDFLTRQIRSLAKRVRFLRKHRVLFESLPETGPCNAGIDFDHLPHKDVIRVIRAFGGKWKKTPVDHTRITYETEVDGLTVRCWQGEPPPNCKIVEYEELVPERIIPAMVIKKKKLVCQPEFAAVIATAAEKERAGHDSNDNNSVF